MSGAGPESVPESSIPDDVWEKFVRDSERDIRASAPTEPSARARMVTERLRAMDEAQAARAGGGGKRRWGRKNAPVPPARPEGWRTGPPVQDIGGTSRRRRVWSAVGVVVAVALAVVAVNPSAALSWLPGGFGEGSGASNGAQSASGTPLAPETARPGTAPPAAPTDVPTRDKPFAGSPAARWESGADAIRLPVAKPVNGVPAARMAAALKGTKDFLVAANLDPAVLEGARPEKALALMDPAQRDYLAELNAGLRKPTADNDPVGTITRFDPDEIEVVSEARVRGHMTVEAGDGRPGTAVIKADYTFVYPVARAGGGDEVTRTVVRRSIEVEAVDPARFRAAEGHIRIVSTRSEISNDDCRDGDGVIRPQFLADRQNGAGTSGEARDPYDRSRELTGARDDDECGVVTRL
ncbi:hypothetical protein CD934_12785 [Streptomyces calvus]|uniref:Uncharacterized protein n=1 Tax=Streptomyces calvus TaxID=67282 RepID=A0A514JQ54_9ACTN|nr:hypothetical protein [Streptomyces calvus]QDI69479.1 hypothetical protein CD934_12785 [Streptomyces calvus]